MASRTISATASEAIPANANRKSLVIQNEDTTDAVYVMREAGEAVLVSATVHDIKLGPGSSISVNSLLDGIKAVQARYTCIASANTPRIAVFESEDILR
jgi:hypothetical protein